MQPYKIPQNVQIEDKIFGNILTLRQLLIIGLGGGISYVLYTVMAKYYVLNILETGIIIIPGAISVAFAFVKINDITLFKYCLLLAEFIIKPRKRVWDKRGNVIYLGMNVTQKVQKSQKKTKEEKKAKKLNKQEALANLDEISKMLDSQ